MPPECIAAWIREHGVSYHVPEILPTQEQLLRSHVMSRIDNVGCTIETVTHEMKQAMQRLFFMESYLLHNIQPFLHRAMIQTCMSLTAFSDARCLGKLAELEVRTNSSEKNEVHVCHFPDPVHHVPDVLQPEIPLYVLRPLPSGKDAKRAECSLVPGNVTLCIEDKLIKNSIGALVFRFPNTGLVGIGTDAAMGLARNSLLMFTSSTSSVELLTGVTRTAVEDIGGLVIWVHASTDTFYPGPRALRARGDTVVSPPSNGAIVVRRRGFRWVIGSVDASELAHL